MINKKKIIAISSEILNNKLVHLSTSCGKSVSNENGIDFESALNFLHSLVWMRQSKKGLVFVCYAFSRDNEFIFSTMPTTLKDKLFQSHTFRERQDRLEYELEQIENDLYSADTESQEYQQLDFERYVNKISIRDFAEIKYKDFTINLRNGKILTIKKGGKSISIYDVYGFFKPKSLRESVNQWLKSDVPVLDKEIFKQNPFYLENELEQLKIHCRIEANHIAKLVTKLNDELQENNINLSRFHGATAVTSHLLTKWKVKGSKDENGKWIDKPMFYNYRNQRQLSPELYKAVMQSYYGGRSEQFKIGTLKDVNIYDINSAYAYASCFLPVMLKKPYFVKSWQAIPFSIYYCEYDFTNLGLYFGLLPNRDSNNITRYKTKGKGYFWQPEIQFIINNYPECIDIKHGFVLDYEPAPFTQNIQDLYNLRLELQAENNPLEKVIKLALSSIYGKFCQHNGKGQFYNMFYAGFITSFTRMMLLEATKGNEEKTICFQTDAIHTTAILPVSISRNLGEYKHSFYKQNCYLDNGIYKAQRKNGSYKTKNRGFKTFDFEKALKELNEKSVYSEKARFFIGHNLNELDIFDGEYLEDFSATAKMQPLENQMRIFDIKNFDFDINESFLDSRIIPFYNGQESLLYRQTSYKDTDAGIDSIEAMRI